MINDYDIVKETKLEKITSIAAKIGLSEDDIEVYGNYKAKINLDVLDKLADRKDGKYVIVTSALNANAAGEGKTSTEIGLNDALNAMGVKSIACLREPSQGVSLGNKGPAHGALHAQIVPSDVDYHFTGDIHALTYTINTIAAAIDNSIYQGNPLNIDPDRIIWNRAIDVCDRALRDVTVMQGDKKGTPHKCEFVITVAHELTSIATLAESEEDFMNHAREAIVAYTYDNKEVRIKDLRIDHTIALLMKDALKPNLVQSLEHNPVIVSGTPFANISIGTNSILASKIALKLADIVLVENGFGSDCAAEKHLDLVCPRANIKPNGILAVVSARSLKLHGGHDKNALHEPDAEAVRKGLINMQAHIDHLKQYGLPLVIAINKFSFDTDDEIKIIADYLDTISVPYGISNAPNVGGSGSIELAEVLLKEIKDVLYTPLYSMDDDIKTKIFKVSTKCYGAGNVEYSDLALKQIEEYESKGCGKLPICISKTPASITDDATILGAPKGFTIHIREVRVYTGAGFIVPLSGSLLLLPGLGKNPRMSDDYTKR